MSIHRCIDSDYKSLRRYFEKMFIFLNEAIDEERSVEPEIEDCFSEISQSSFHNISQYIKPDMILNTYSFLDYWLNQICEFQMHRTKSQLHYKDVKADNDLAKRNKYLNTELSLDVRVEPHIYQRLQDLRKVRNRFVHYGGYVDSETIPAIKNIKGVKVTLVDLIYIKDSFVWETLDAASKYLKSTCSAR